MTYVLYGDRGSGSAPVEMALAEIGSAVELRPISFEGNEHLTPAYRRINPMGRLPTLLLPDGTVVTESLAILVTLADRHPDAGLLPPAADPARAVALRWLALAAGEIYPCVTRNDFPERFGADAPSIRAHAIAMAREFWQVIETHAAPSPFVLGARFSVTDLHLSVLSRWMGNAEWMAAHCPRIEALAQAVAARPKSGPVWARHFG